MTINELRTAVEATKARSAWSKGVKRYAIDLIEELEEDIRTGWFKEDNLSSSNLLQKQMLNGARDWKQYSEGGCSLWYNEDIAERLCTPSELKRIKYWCKNPNPRETWLDVQARALYQASNLILSLIR